MLSQLSTERFSMDGAPAEQHHACALCARLSGAEAATRGDNYRIDSSQLVLNNVLYMNPD